MTDEDYMRLALELAEKGCGWTSPNPMVGAVIVKNGEIIGQGCHLRYGEAHAERNALASCTQPPAGATMYVTLEPCCHYGKQPPCTDAILEAGIARVVIGSSDPNPLVSGKGTAALMAHGVAVTEHVLEKECRKLNEVFFHYITAGSPFVAMKYAMTLDGKIAACTGASRWITGEEARAHAHALRHRYRAIMAGVQTVLDDDPMLTCRIEGGRNPIRIICDTALRTPLVSKIVQTAQEAPVILATCCTDQQKCEPYRELGCRLLAVPEKQGHVDLKALMAQLGAEGIDSILLEGGAELNWSAVSAGIVNKVYAYIAPSILGGAGAKTPVGGKGADDPGHAFGICSSTVRRIGRDFLIEGYLQPGT